MFLPDTRVLFTESPGSHTFEVQDIPMLARVAHAADAKEFHGQYWGMMIFPALRAWGGRVDPGADEICWRAFGYCAGAVVVNSEEDWQLAARGRAGDWAIRLARMIAGWRCEACARCMCG